jgi:hypothetical protein
VDDHSCCMSGWICRAWGPSTIALVELLQRAPVLLLCHRRIKFRVENSI